MVIVYLALLKLLVLGSIALGRVVGELGRFANLIPEAGESLGQRFGRLGVWSERIVGNLPPFVTDVLDQRLGLQMEGAELAVPVVAVRKVMLEDCLLSRPAQRTAADASEGGSGPPAGSDRREVATSDLSGA